jgi:hypothetical protein
MNFEALGNLGDFIGGFGVIATLLYLAVQIRSNTKEVRSASLDSTRNSYLESQRSLWRDPELVRVWFSGMAGEDLSESDGRRFTLMLISVAREWEIAYHKSRGGTLDSASWAGIGEEFARTFATPGAQQYWKRIRFGFTPEFVSFAERSAQDAVPIKTGV